MKVERRITVETFHDVNFSIAGPVLTVRPKGRPVRDLGARRRDVDPGLHVTIPKLESFVTVNAIIGICRDQCARRSTQV
jgi:hypothetical protein